MTTLHLRKSIDRSPLRLGFLVIPLVLACFAITPRVQAVFPPPDGGYPGGNTAEGDNALSSLTSGGANTAIGLNALFSNRSGDRNTATGADALLNNTTGGNNTATGVNALMSNITGFQNTANGPDALFSNTTGHDNTATGYQALLFNRGNVNTANGSQALLVNTTGSGNTAIGVQALLSNNTGGANTANGYQALYHNTTGLGNTANGYQALFHNPTSFFNTAMGRRALFNTTGSGNIALGFGAGENLTTGSSNIDIGNQGVAGEAATIRIGRQGTQTATFIAGISGVAVTGTQVVVNSNGRLGVAASSARLKEAIKPMDNTSEAIHALRPVTFRYRRDIDPAGTSQFGLVAEEVEKVSPDLVVRDADGEIYTVRYEAVNAMLLNEFLKEHRKNEEQEATIGRLKSTDAKQEATIAKQQKQIEALTAGLQKVSAQLELSRPARQVVENDQ